MNKLPLNNGRSDLFFKTSTSSTRCRCGESRLLSETCDVRRGHSSVCGVDGQRQRIEEERGLGLAIVGIVILAVNGQGQQQHQSGDFHGDVPGTDAADKDLGGFYRQKSVWPQHLWSKEVKSPDWIIFDVGFVDFGSEALERGAMFKQSAVPVKGQGKSMTARIWK